VLLVGVEEEVGRNVEDDIVAIVDEADAPGRLVLWSSPILRAVDLVADLLDGDAPDHDAIAILRWPRRAGRDCS
jgi:hypothetical protein